jgi:diguanylate cyclase (GGDEF)-like protein
MSANHSNTPQSHAPGAAVLVIGEHSTDALTLASKLDRSTDSGAHYSLVVAPTRDDAMRLLAAQNYAVIVQSMLGSTKEYVETLRYLRTNARNTHTALILIAPNGLDHAHAMRTLEGGAVDCIDKPADEFVLRAKVKMFVDMARTTARLNEVQGRDSINDPLTGLPTRLLMMDRVGQAIRHAGRTNGRVALAVIDLDQFQDVRETLGPASGDELLRQIALRLTGSLRRSDTVARIGEDEFAVVLACDTRDGVATVSQRLERVIVLAWAKESASHCSLSMAAIPSFCWSAPALQWKWQNKIGLDICFTIRSNTKRWLKITQQRQCSRRKNCARLAQRKTALLRTPAGVVQFHFFSCAPLRFAPFGDIELHNRNAAGRQCIDGAFTREFVGKLGHGGVVAHQH